MKHVKKEVKVKCEKSLQSLRLPPPLLPSLSSSETMICLFLFNYDLGATGKKNLREAKAKCVEFL